MSRIELTVARKWSVAEQIAAFALQGAPGHVLPQATPGAHLDVHVPGGLIRQYSLCNGPGASDEYVIAVKRETASRGGSAAMHDRVQVGDRLTVSEPKNNFPLDAVARRRVLVAGGIGITPLLSMARHLSDRGEDFELCYFCRGRAHAAFAAELELEFGERLRLHAGLDATQTGAAIDALLAAPAEGTHVYTCGPEPLMARVQQAADRNGWPQLAVHLEHFQAPGPADVSGGAFEVRLARSGRTIAVPVRMTLVEALRAAGVEIETSCEQGVCGTCLCSVLEGSPDHRDVYLSSAEKAAGTRMLPCVSRARTPYLVLDL